jgi:lauroyl/myristoyl acyltransferase
VRNSDDSFTLRIEKPIEFILTDDRERDLASLAGKYRDIIEDYVRRYPDQWYMFRKFWQD